MTCQPIIAGLAGDVGLSRRPDSWGLGVTISATMKLTRTERWILSNQYRILEKLYPEDADAFRDAQDALNSGYELEYGHLAERIYAEKHTLNEDECREVLDILAMFRDLKYGYKEVGGEKGTGVEEWLVQFSGFDGNNESSHLGYCRYICDPKHGRFQELDRGDDYNSHMPSLDRYRRMLDEWRPRSERGHGKLTAEDIRAIASAAPHPQSDIGKAIRDKGPRH